MTSFKRGIILISVEDNPTGLDDFQYLYSKGWTFLATEKTAAALLALEIHSTVVPQLFDVAKPSSVHKSILDLDILDIVSHNLDDEAQMESLRLRGLKPVDIVVASLPEANSDGLDVTKEEASLHSLITTASRNLKNVTVLVDPHDYKQTVDEMASRGVGSVSKKTREDLAAKAVGYLYDRDKETISWLAQTGFGGMGMDPFLLC